ncbi:class-II fumarase/aspartase family protein [Larsenimonas rhizosphaerae]|uniref:Adenylosuccinate lyase family protein n=1 Tax=Larsenimonas rhizosphaerae TaxID=2944682 RepID=A0AA41ZI58_9GAMM|nr:adenylosuccinate lyase family protein [Larsenimonas rhizosphaerae]MCX2525151.1 adenylosuccinate lyase family protein [Larsenimonas rhizosphaerae]
MFERLLHHPFMSTVALRESGAEALIDAMLSVELALAEAEQARGIIPPDTAEAMREALSTLALDADDLFQGCVDGGNMAIPFVSQCKAALPPALVPFFHRGATSQDLVDTALMLVLRPRLTRSGALLSDALSAGRDVMMAHQETPMVGRTLMQQALPISFGAKVAQWLYGLALARERLEEARASHLLVQFGGAVGVHSGLDEVGLSIMDDMAHRLGLSAPILPWHTQRQPILLLAGAMDAVAVAVEKIATDVALLCQTEIGELSEPAGDGVGGSSSMPHKRNPVACARIRAAARHIHADASLISTSGASPLERGLGEWHAEWQPLLAMAALLEGALESTCALLQGLEVHQERMQANLQLTGGAIMAEPATRLLSEVMSAAEARALAREAALEAQTTGQDLASVLMKDARVNQHISHDDVARVVAPASYLGSSLAQVDRMDAWLSSH